MVKLGAAVLFSTLGMETVTVLIAVAGLAVLLLASFSSSVPLAVVGGVVRDRFTFELAYTGMAIEGVEAAVVTGSSSGIGLALSRMLVKNGYEVFGFGRNFERAEAQEFCKEQPEKFHAVVCDITDTQALCAHIKEIDKNYRVTVLVNNAGVGYYGLHEELNPKKIQKMVRTNLEAPMILTQQLLRTLKKNRGTVLNISSVTAAQSNPHGCAYGATKAGLSGFAKSLFDEVRKYGVRVITIQPDMAKTDLYRNADFCEGEEEASYLLPEEVAEAAAFALAQREGLVVTEITVKPQFHRIRRK